MYSLDTILELVLKGKKERNCVFHFRIATHTSGLPKYLQKAEASIRSN